MKVEGILNESGMPTEEHKSVLDANIATAIEEFETASGDLLTNADEGFTVYLMEAEMAFADAGETMEAMAGESLSCLDQARVDFTDVFNNPENNEIPAAGLMVEF
jgi:hypothetical protein